MLMGYLVIGEVLSRLEIATIIGGTIGILILLNPEWFGNQNNLTAAQLKQEVSMKDWILGVIFGIAFAFTCAMKFVTIRAIGDTIHTSIKNYYFGTLGVFSTLIINIFADPEFF